MAVPIKNVRRDPLSGICHFQLIHNPLWGIHKYLKTLFKHYPVTINDALSNKFFLKCDPRDFFLFWHYIRVIREHELTLENLNNNNLAIKHETGHWSLDSNRISCNAFVQKCFHSRVPYIGIGIVDSIYFYIVGQVSSLLSPDVRSCEHALSWLIQSRQKDLKWRLKEMLSLSFTS